MAPSDWELFYGKGAKPPQNPSQPLHQPPSRHHEGERSMSFVEAYTMKKSYGPNAILPPDLINQFRVFAAQIQFRL